MREIDDIDGLFKESFEGFEVTPPASVKAKIDKEIKRKTGLIWWLSALFLVLIATAGYFVLNNRSTRDHSSAEIASAQQTDSPSQNGSNQTSSSNSIKNHALADSQAKNNTSIDKSGSTEKLQANKSFSQNKNIQNAATSGNQSKKNVSTKTETPSKTVVSKTKTKQSVNNKNKNKNTSKLKTQPANKLKNFKLTNKQVKGTNPKNNSLPTKNPTSVSDPKSINSPNPKSLDKQPASKEKELTSLDPEKKPFPSIDSTTAALTKAYLDATTEPETLTSTGDTSDNDDEDKNNWTLSFYAGPQFDIWKTSSQDEELTLKTSFRTSLEINRNLPFNLSVSSGVGYNKFEEKYSLNYIISIDSVYIGLDSIPIYDQQNPDSVVGYTYVDQFGVDTVKGNRNNTFNTTAISIPLHLRRTFEITENWVVMTDLGATFNFYKTTKDSSSDPLSPEPLTNSFGINASMRLHAGYKLNNWMFTAGVNGSLYLKTPVTYDGLNNKRYYFSPQLGIHYTF